MTRTPAERAFIHGYTLAARSLDPRPDRVGLILVENRHVWDDSRLYHEAHINFEHVDDRLRSQIEVLTRAAQLRGTWRLATFEMHRERQPTGFVTGRHSSYAVLLRDVMLMTGWISGIGVPILRYKIEDTLLDSKSGDTL